MIRQPNLKHIFLFLIFKIYPFCHLLKIWLSLQTSFLDDDVDRFQYMLSHIRSSIHFFLDALASLDSNLSVDQSVSDWYFSDFQVNQVVLVVQVIQVIQAIHVIHIIPVIRDEICHCRQCQRQCIMFASGVNLSIKQHIIWHD